MEWYGVTIIVMACIVLLIIILKLYLVLTTGWDRSPTCLIGKTVIVTGSNTGIGYYTALDFAKRGARVILACRDPKRAEEARTKMIEATGNANIVVKLVDLGSFDSIRQFAKEINTTEEKVDVLVNNAGAGGFNHTITPDGLSLSMQINYFGPFLLTILLLGALKKSSASRIVNVSSGAARYTSLKIEALNAEPTGFFGKPLDYAHAKLCNILFSNELARKLKGSTVVVNALHPGAVQTDFFRNTRNPYRTIAFIVSRTLYKPTEAGAQTSIYVAVSKDIDGVTGAYFADCKRARMPNSANNLDFARSLWEKSLELVKLTPYELQFI